MGKDADFRKECQGKNVDKEILDGIIISVALEAHYGMVFYRIA